MDAISDLDKTLAGVTLRNAMTAQRFRDAVTFLTAYTDVEYHGSAAYLHSDEVRVWISVGDVQGQLRLDDTVDTEYFQFNGKVRGVSGIVLEFDVKQDTDVSLTEQFCAHLLSVMRKLNEL